MPHYELSLFMKSMAKKDVINAVARNIKCMLDRDVVITKLESLGHKDLPYKVLREKEPHYTANYFLVDCYMPLLVMRDVMSEMTRDGQVLRHYFAQIPSEEEPIPECTLSDELLPPPYRKSVKELRENQRIGHYARLVAYKHAEQAWRSVAKSFTIATTQK